MSVIIDLRLREILDSRGHPTVEADIRLDDGSLGRASVPSGASVGTYEAIERRDDHSSRYHGRGIKGVIEATRHDIFDAISGLKAADQAEIDRILCALDGTENKSRLGGNIILATSLAVAKAASQSLETSFYRYLGGMNARLLPVPLLNILNGGKHADNPLLIQEFMIMPLAVSSFREALRCGSEIYHHLRKLLEKASYSVNLGDEGGFAPSISKASEALEMLTRAVEIAGYKAGKDVVFALDCAANEFFDAKKECYKPEDKALSSDEMIDYLEKLVDDWPIFSIEDGLAEDDQQGWCNLTARLGTKVQLVGDDFFVTNPKRLKQGIIKKQANAILIKPNQIGTLTETLNAVTMAHCAGYKAVLSHRSGETEDTSIADLSVATQCGQIKAGAIARSERTAKYNRLLRIEESLGESAHYAGCDLIEVFLQNRKKTG